MGMETEINEKRYLLSNPGSASKKYALYGQDGSVTEELLNVHIEREDGKVIAEAKTKGGISEKRSLTEEDFLRPLPYVLALCEERKLIRPDAPICAGGIRIVAPGKYFQAHRIIDVEYEKRLEEARYLAPLHLESALAELSALKAELPGVALVGVSDSAFNSTMGEVARRYALPEETADKSELYRFGYHGISMQSARGKVEEMLGAVPARSIICHLGSGVSIAALRGGDCVDTSMGFTPLEGVPMATRIGAIDAGAVLQLTKLGMSPQEIELFLNKECGLKGLSGRTGDVRELIELEKQGDAGAKLAIEHFVYHIKKQIGAYIAVLDGIDLLAFTGTIGERSSIIRGRIVSGLEAFGIILDMQMNDTITGKSGLIGAADSAVNIAVVLSDEMRVMAGETARLVSETQ